MKGVLPLILLIVAGAAISALVLTPRVPLPEADPAVGGGPSPHTAADPSGVGAPRPQGKEVKEIRHAADDSVMMVIPATE